jgi:hypothetical protein
MGAGGEDDCIACAAAACVNGKLKLAAATRESKHNRLHEGTGFDAIRLSPPK